MPCPVRRLTRSKGAIIGGACALIALVPALRGDAPKSASHGAAATVLPVFTVNTTPITPFGVSLEGFVDPKTKKVLRLVITGVREGSDAEKARLKPGDEVIAVNGRRLDAMHSGMERGSEIFNLFINRPPGEIIDLQVVTQVTRSVSLRATPIIGP